MSITDIFWLFFMFTALQPLLRQRMLEAMRTRKSRRSSGIGTRASSCLCIGRKQCGCSASR